MGKVLKILGLVFLILLVGFVALLFWAHGQGEAQQKQFFDAIAAGEPNVLLAMMAPDLRNEMDPPVVKMWMAMVNERLGAYQGLSATDFHSETEIVAQGKVTRSEGLARFDKGEAQTRLTWLNGKIVGFEIKCDAMLNMDWLTRPKGDLYARRALAFFQTLVSEKPEEALSMMHPTLSEQFTPEQLASGMARFLQKYGPVQGIEITEQRFGEGPAGKSLYLQGTCRCENGDVKVTLRYDFDSFRGHIRAFEIPAE